MQYMTQFTNSQSLVLLRGRYKFTGKMTDSNIVCYNLKNCLEEKNTS